MEELIRSHNNNEISIIVILKPLHTQSRLSRGQPEEGICRLKETLEEQPFYYYLTYDKGEWL
jgi:hypothetical protein